MERNRITTTMLGTLILVQRGRRFNTFRGRNGRGRPNYEGNSNGHTDDSINKVPDQDLNEK